MNGPRVSAIFARGVNGVIGNDNRLPWPRFPMDQSRFTRLTVGKPIIMGGNTWRSLRRSEPLKCRHNIIVTKKPWEIGAGADIVAVKSLDAAFKCARRWTDRNYGEEIMVIGGGDIFQQAYDRIDRVYATILMDTFPGETFDPILPRVWASTKWRIVNSTPPLTDERNPIPMVFEQWDRVTP